MKSLACLLLGLALAAPASTPATPAPMTFFGVVVHDAEASAAWYARTFRLRELKRIDDPAYAVRILSREGLLVELIQHRPAPPAAPERRLGHLKAGLVLDDFDGELARWRKEDVKFFGGAPRVYYEQSIGLHNTLLLDPDGNLIQVFGRSASASR